MKRAIGSLLIALSVVCMVMTLRWAGREIPHPGATQREGTTLLLVLFAGIFLAMESAVLLTGRYLRKRRPPRRTEQKEHPRVERSPALVIYLAASIGFALLGGLLVITRFTDSVELAPWVCQPWFLSSLLGVRLSTGMIRHAYVINLHMLWYLALFYPLYHMATMDRTADVALYRYMQTLQVLFLGVHVLAALLTLVVMKA